MKTTTRAALGGFAGLIATAAMDYAGTLIWERWTSPNARAIERGIEPKFPLDVLGERIADELDLHPYEKAGEKISSALHWGIGFFCGALHGLIARRPNVKSAIVAQSVAMGMLATDEFGFSAAGLCPPPSAFPRETHVRAFLSHVTYGLTLALAYGTLHEIASSRRSA